MMLAKPVTTTLQQVERSQIYVIATFGGGAAVFFLLFLACCVFSIQQKRPMLRQGITSPTSGSESTKQVSLQRRKRDAGDVSELTKLTAVTSSSDDFGAKETDSNSSLKFGFQKTASPRLEPATAATTRFSFKFSTSTREDKSRDDVEYQRVPVNADVDVDDIAKADEGYKSMSSTSSASVVSTTTTTSMSPEAKDEPEIPEVERATVQLSRQKEKQVSLWFEH